MPDEEPDGAGARVIVVGSVNIDLIVSVEALPGPGETVIGGTFGRAPGGKGANQAAAAATLGAETALVGMTGDDDFGRTARDDLAQLGVDLSRVGTGGNPTGVALIMVDEGGENLIAVASGANEELDAHSVVEAINALAGDRTVVLANLEVPDEAVLAAASTAQALGCSFVLNPAPARRLGWEMLRWCDVLTPNEHEASTLGWPSVDNMIEQGVKAVVVTRGREGASLYRPNAPRYDQPAFEVRAVDTTGAGDAFSAALAWAIARGLPIEEGVRVACGAGALATRKVGARASLPNVRELEEFVSSGGRSGRT
jgi:ribokinase